MKKLVLILCLVSSSIFANGVIIQNTTQNPLLITYYFCPTYHFGFFCGSPQLLKLDKQSSNYNNPLISPNKEMKWIGVAQALNLDNGKIEKFSFLTSQCNAGVSQGIITFSPLVDDPDIIECSTGSYKK